MREMRHCVWMRLGGCGEQVVQRWADVERSELIFEVELLGPGFEVF